ncbi:MAG TPA: protein kinase [Verrucomicrobiae bacterium]
MTSGSRHGFCAKCLVLQAKGCQMASLGDGSTQEPSKKTDASGPSTSSAPNRQSGSADHVGDYELLEQIGRGGMGVVYRARQRSLNRIVALKMMAFGPGCSPELIKRFRAEAVSAASLHHPNIVAIHEVGVHEDRHFFVMDYVEGQSLARLAGNQPLPAKRAAAYLEIIAEAVDYAHERGILHRDLKPSNVLIDDQDQPRIVDFGLAKRFDDSQLSTLNSQLTVTGQVLGSPHYLPPEQATGQRTRISRRTDVYALGATLYHLLTGRPPFQAESLAQTLDLVRQADPVSPRALNPTVPVDLETICLKCLEKEPARRYASARELADELARFQAGKPIRARPLGVVGKTWRCCRRKPQVASLATVALLATCLGIGGLVWQREQARAGELKARQNGYVVSVMAAEQALKAKEPGQAKDLLERQLPASKSETDLRGFEWRYLWQQCQTDAEAVVGRLASPVRCLEVSPDGRWLAAGADSGGLKLWDLSTGKALTLSAGPSARIRTFAAFSPDSRFLLFTEQSVDAPPPIGTVVVWDLGARKRLAPIKDLRPIGPMAFSPDGRYFGHEAAIHWKDRTTAGGALVIRDFPGGKFVAEILGETDLMSSVHGYDWVFTPDGRHCIATSPGPPCRFALWEFASGTNAQTFPTRGEPIIALAINPEGNLLATGSGWTEKVIRLWELPTFRFLGELAGHSGWVAGLRFSPDGKTLASASADQTIRLWDVSTRGQKRVAHQLLDGAWRVCFSPDGRKLFGGSEDGYIYCWPADPLSSEPRSWVRVTDLAPETVVIAPDGRSFAGIRQGVACLAQAQGEAPPSPVPALGTNNAALLFSADGQCLFAGTQQGELQVWQFSQQQVLRRLRGSDAPVRHLAQDAEGRTLVVVQWADPVPKDVSAHPGVARLAQGNRQWFYGLRVERPTHVGVWSLSKWREEMSFTIPSTVETCAVSPDGKLLATGHAADTVCLWNLKGRLSTNLVSCPGGAGVLSFSPDGHFLAAGRWSPGMIRVWELPALQSRIEFPQAEAVNAIAFSPDSKRLATAGAGGRALRLWDVATWQQLLTLEHSPDGVASLSFSRDGNQLSIVAKAEVRFWRSAPRAELQAKDKAQAR